MPKRARARPDKVNPEWSARDFARARPAAEMVPGIVEAARRGRGPQRAPTKKLVSMRLDEDVIAHFRRRGRGWQRRINDTLRKAAKLPPKAQARRRKA